MRTFKFRAWNGKKILSSDRIGYFTINDLCHGYWGETMQFLNYLDSNGKEVYQDDILKIVRLNNTTGNIFNEIAVAPNEVYGDFITQVMRFEVIGNIHENPDIVLTKDKTNGVDIVLSNGKTNGVDVVLSNGKTNGIDIVLTENKRIQHEK